MKVPSAEQHLSSSRKSGKAAKGHVASSPQGGIACPAALAAAVALVVGAASCAKERPPINRVQADALAKSFFVGARLDSPDDDPEFYKRGSVVDVAYGAAQDGLFTSSYGQPLSRVRWEITEDALNARLSYERIAGTDNKGNAYDGVQGKTKTANDGQIVATYKISSHFDVKHDYNPQTGEQLNIVVENTTDRPWYEREYFRVDWSQNLVTTAYDYDTLSLVGVIGGVKYEPFAYTVLDPTSDDAPHFDTAAGYFDVTNKVYATPQQVDLSAFGGTGTMPACLLNGAYVQGGSYPSGDCNPIELTIRESYRKVVDTDYEPENFDGVRFQAIGAFNSDYRMGYARNYGLVDSEWTRFIARYNIWQKSHYYSNPDAATGPTGAIACATKATTEDPTGDPKADPNRDLDGNGTADECELAGPGARCDIFKQKCTLPYRRRTTRTIPWYIAGDTSLFEPTDWAVLEWDLALRTAVQTSRLTECRRTGPRAATRPTRCGPDSRTTSTKPRASRATSLPAIATRAGHRLLRLIHVPISSPARRRPWQPSEAAAGTRMLRRSPRSCACRRSSFCATTRSPTRTIPPVARLAWSRGPGTSATTRSSTSRSRSSPLTGASWSTATIH
jgi:hypothetical protein